METLKRYCKRTQLTTLHFLATCSYFYIFENHLFAKCSYWTRYSILATLYFSSSQISGRLQTCYKRGIKTGSGNKPKQIQHEALIKKKKVRKCVRFIKK